LPAATEIKLVVFDWAGTVADYGSLAPAGAFVEVFAARGVSVSMAEARAPMGLHKKDHLRVLLQTPPIARRWAEVRGRAWAADDLEEMYRDLVPLQLAAIGRHADLVPGLLGCVARLRGLGLRVGGTTGYFRTAADGIAAAAREQGFVPDWNVCADDVPAGRPAPWMIFRVMEGLGVYPPAAVVKVGDTVPDIEEGRNAGAWSVGVVDSSSEIGLSVAEFNTLTEDDRASRRRGVRERFAAAGAHEVIDSLAELPSLIGHLRERLARGEKP
jgi:phosphonoacetaldehyde hydrolase